MILTGMQASAAPVWPSSPTVHLLSLPCRARSLVSILMTLVPQFWANVRGMTSSAWPTALYGPASGPCTTSHLSWQQCKGLLTSWVPADCAAAAADVCSTPHGNGSLLHRLHLDCHVDQTW